MSPADIKNSLSSLPVYLGITGILTVAVYFIGGGFEDAIMGGLESWLSMGVALYLPVLVAAVAILLISFIFYLVKAIIRR